MSWTQLEEALRGAPNLPRAACKGRSELFDTWHDDEPWPERDRRHAEAVQACLSCPELEPCRQWLESMHRSKRPDGVVAAKVPGRNKPQVHDERKPKRSRRKPRPQAA